MFLEASREATIEKKRFLPQAAHPGHEKSLRSMEGKKFHEIADFGWCSKSVFLQLLYDGHTTHCGH